MASLALIQPQRAVPDRQPARELDGASRGVLNALRMIAMECRSAARTDLFQACALLSGQNNVAEDAHARALIRCLKQALGSRPAFYRPGEVDLTFDEAWLMRCIASCRAQDWPSFEFLLRSRIPFAQRRSVSFLIHGIADRFSRL